MKKLILLLSSIVMIASLSYAGGYYRQQISCSPTQPGVYKQGTYNIGEIQTYTMWVSGSPHLRPSGPPVSFASISAYGKNGECLGSVYHMNTFNTGETQSTIGPVYVQYFTYNLGADPDLWQGYTLYATAIISW